MSKKWIIGGSVLSSLLLSSAIFAEGIFNKTENVAHAATLSEMKNQLEENQSQKTTLKWQINELNNQINDLNSQASAVEVEAKEIDEIVMRVQGEINTLEEQIKQIEKNIGDIKYEKSILERNISEAKRTFEAQTKHLTGENADYLDYALKSDNSLTMKLRLEQLDMAYKVYESAVSHYEAEIKDRNSKEGTLNLERNNVEEKKKVLVIKKEFVDEKLSEKVALLDSLKSDIDSQHDTHSDLEQSAVLVDQMISGLQRDISDEEKRQAEEANRLLALKNSQKNNSSFGSSSDQYTGNVDSSEYNGQLLWPSTTSYRTSSPFGYRSDPFTGEKSLHGGQDIPAASGSPIVASEDGVVLTSGWINGYGYAVIIKHSETLTTLYGHCSKTLVQAGETVKRGQKIALVGSTGRSTGPHIHFEVRINGTRVNPLPYLK